MCRYDDNIELNCREMRCDGVTEFNCHRLRSDCQRGNKTFGPVKSSEFLHRLNDYHCMKDSSHVVMEYVVCR